MVAFEKMEAVRYANFLKPQGVAVINDYEIASATIAAGQFEYPAGCLEAMQNSFQVFSLKAADIAMSLGSAKCMNIVLFGALTHVLKHGARLTGKTVIRDTVPPKFLELNLQAYPRRSGGRQKAVKAYKRRTVQALTLPAAAGNGLDRSPFRFLRFMNRRHLLHGIKRNVGLGRQPFGDPGPV